MSRLPRVLLAVAAVVLVAVATGCGSGADPATYVKEMNETQVAFSKQFARAQKGMRPDNSAAASGRVLARLQKALETTLGELRKIEPPDSVKELHEQVISEVAAFEASVAKAEGQFASNSPKEIIAAQTDLSTGLEDSATRINATITKINAKLH